MDGRRTSVLLLLGVALDKNIVVLVLLVFTVLSILCCCSLFLTKGNC